MTYPMNHFDDCSGIGGFSLACKWAGIETKWAREIDPYARKVYALRFPKVELFKDVKEPLPEGLKGQVDLYTCGFPCQPVSCAGKRKGQDDPRWLWPWVARTISFLRPRYVLLENVPGLLIRGMGDVLGDLATCGYDAEWDCLPASAFGAPHRRDRVWIVAYPKGTGKGTTKQPGQRHGIIKGGQDVAHSQSRQSRQSSQQKGRPSTGGRGKEMADTESKQGNIGIFRQSPEEIAQIQFRGLGSHADQWAVEPNVDRVVDGVPSRVDRLKCLGNAIVPQVAYWIIKRLAQK